MKGADCALEIPYYQLLLFIKVDGGLDRLVLLVRHSQPSLCYFGVCELQYLSAHIQDDSQLVVILRKDDAE